MTDFLDNTFSRDKPLLLLQILFNRPWQVCHGDCKTRGVRFEVEPFVGGMFLQDFLCLPPGILTIFGIERKECIRFWGHAARQYPEYHL